MKCSDTEIRYVIYRIVNSSVLMIFGCDFSKKKRKILIFESRKLEPYLTLKILPNKTFFLCKRFSSQLNIKNNFEIISRASQNSSFGLNGMMYLNIYFKTNFWFIKDTSLFDLKSRTTDDQRWTQTSNSYFWSLSEVCQKSTQKLTQNLVMPQSLDYPR